MALADLIQGSEVQKIGLSKERVQAIIPVARQYIAFWREYPDLFVDFLQTGIDPTRKKRLKFFYYQRVFLRAATRHKYCYFTFPRRHMCGK